MTIYSWRIAKYRKFMCQLIGIYNYANYQLATLFKVMTIYIWRTTIYNWGITIYSWHYTKRRKFIRFN